MLTGFVSCNKEDSFKTIKLAHSLSVDHPVHQAIVYMADEIKNNSDGKLRIEVYSGGQLGSERQCLELLQIGTLGMTKVSTAVMENFSPEWKVFGYPYLFKNDGHRYRVCDGEIGQKMLGTSKEYWLKGLTYFDAGSRSFYSKSTPIEKPNDLNGLKIRVMQSATAIELVKSLGGSPTPISWGELYTALQQGIVDGAENNLASFYTNKHYEVCKYLSLDEHTSIPDILLISTGVWDDLSEKEKQWLEAAVKKATIYQRKLWRQQEEKILQELKKAGINVLAPDKKAFMERSAHMYRELRQENENLYQLVEQINHLE